MGIDCGPAPAMSLAFYKRIQQERLRAMAGGKRDTQDWASIRHASKFLTANEIREALGLYPIAGGDVMGCIAPPRPVCRAEFDRRRAAGARTLAEIDPDLEGWFHGVLIFYVAVAFCVFIVGLGFLFFFLLSRFV